MTSSQTMFQTGWSSVTPRRKWDLYHFTGASLMLFTKATAAESLEDEYTHRRLL